MTYEGAQEYYQSNFSDDMTFGEISEKINQMDNFEGVDEIRQVFCDNFLSVVAGGFVRYEDKFFLKSEEVTLFKGQVEKLPKDYYFFWAVYYYFCGNKNKTLTCLKKAMEVFKGRGNEITEQLFVSFFVEPFKQGFDGFWNEVYNELTKYEVDNSILEFCKLIEEYYQAKSNEELVEKFGYFIFKYQEFDSAKELLANIYQQIGMWKNAIACMERVNHPKIFFECDIYFMLAWAYGKCKETKKEEENYRKCLELYPDAINAMNNLAYSLYTQKRYIEAKDLLEKCLEEQRDLPFSANNYLRVLIALGRNSDAKRFIKDTSYKISKSLVERVDKLDNSNARLKKVAVIEESEEEVISLKGNKIDTHIKRQQFSSEKILEDELTARIESGQQVFGLDLKVYRRHGIYGRQFIIPIGRLDLLCEDENGDLYIIELKKDSGYDDAYKQTSDYLDWFEKNEISKDKNVYGIICLNSPTKELIEKVHKDRRMKLFEYRISYTEI